MAATVASQVLPAATGVSSRSPVSRRAQGPPAARPIVLRNSFHGSSLRLNPVSKAQLRFAPLPVRASQEAPPPPSVDTEKVVADLKEKWEKVENKPAIALYAGGAAVFVWLSSAVVGAISSVPLLPKLLELVGVGYSGWFVYRYLLFKESRKELASELEELKNKVTGATGLDD